MFAITQEHLSFVGGIIAIAAFIKGITNSIDNKIEKNNQYLENLIDKKLDIIVYETNKKNFEQWSNEKDRIIEEKISKIENSFKSDLHEIKESLKEINQHMLNCKK
jgi:hypothetical protein|nr:MAG TPA: hypothetical protein [Caudoviricetes sp.]